MSNLELANQAMTSSCLAAHHLGETMKLNPDQWTHDQFDQIALRLREANCAVTELQSRAKGNKPPKIGD